MAKIIKEGKLPVKRIEFSMCGNKYAIDVAKFEAMEYERLYRGQNRVKLTMLCDNLEVKPDHSDFMEDVEALARQYGLSITNIEVK